MMETSLPLFAPLSVLYGLAVRTRLELYRRGLFTVSKLAAPVISIGNLTTGGTGKTPLTESIARVLAEQARRVCILTRGYRRHNPNERVVVSDGESLRADAIEAGDEPRLLAESLQGLAAVISDADRFAAGTWALKELGSNAFILDDGFQHLRLARDLDIVVVDATQPWNNGHLLPWGRLREPPSGLSRADCVVITRSDQAEHVDALRDQINELSRNKPIFTSSMHVRGLVPLNEKSSDAGAQQRAVPRPIAVLCGIGNPPAFVRQLNDAGYEQTWVSAFPDHHVYNQQEVDKVVEQAKQAGAACLITTAKDAVKLHGLRFELPCYVLDIQIEIDNKERFVEMIRATVSARPRQSGGSEKL